MAANGIQNYINTLIFCIVAATISVVLLGVLVIEIVRTDFLPLLFTIEIGLMVIISLAIYRIYKYDKRITAELNQLNTSSLLSLTCPDYYTATPVLIKSSDSNVNPYTQMLCRNSYTSANSLNNYVFMGANSAPLYDINLDDGYLKKQLIPTCTSYNSNVSGQAMPPWTDLQSKCEVV